MSLLRLDGRKLLQGTGLQEKLAAMPTGPAHQAIESILTALKDTPLTESEILAVLARVGHGAFARQALFAMYSLTRSGRVGWLLEENGRPVATYFPVGRGFVHLQDDCSAIGRLRLTSDALLRLDENREWVLECAWSACRVVIHDAACLQLAEALRQPIALPALTSAIAGLSEHSIRLLVTFLINSGLAEVDGGASGAEAASKHPHWEFHDRLFHFRSRGRSTTGRQGGTLRLLGTCPPAAAVKTLDGAPEVPLFRPDILALSGTDVTLTWAVEQRRSIRRSQTSITLRELGELLYRTARVKAYRPADPERGLYYDVATRPYPSGGASYSLELYVCVRRCVGLEEGGYYYRPTDHKLVRAALSPADVVPLIDDAARSTGGDPDVVIVFASRFQRVAWKYEATAYSLVLKEVGCLIELMYLVATSMNLSPCAVGGGDAMTFSSAFRLSNLEECSVGEFSLCGKQDKCGGDIP